ncbi:hypothetical protein ZWY2020_038133 [Hordeum vulgare]|nr:hypothetical protein ZWY2020_038133 [Hordeum vulgare]
MLSSLPPRPRLECRSFRLFTGRKQEEEVGAPPSAKNLKNNRRAVGHIVRTCEFPLPPSPIISLLSPILLRIRPPPHPIRRSIQPASQSSPQFAVADGGGPRPSEDCRCCGGAWVGSSLLLFLLSPVLSSSARGADP